MQNRSICTDCGHRIVCHLSDMYIHDCSNYMSPDVVSVVRCRDCANCDFSYPSCDKEGNLTEAYYCETHKMNVKPEHYCGEGIGKRRI